MFERVWEPEAALVPDQPPLAVQLVATGLVDQVRRGVISPVAEVELALSVTVPAVWACTADAARKRTMNSAVFFMAATLRACPTSFKRRTLFCRCPLTQNCGAYVRQIRMKID